MKKYQVNFYDYLTGVTSPIDTIIAPDNYTSTDYVIDCLKNADAEFNEMLSHGKIFIEEV